jgi:hypothetical protein
MSVFETLNPFHPVLDQFGSLVDAASTGIDVAKEAGYGEIPGLSTVMQVVGAGANYTDNLAKGHGYVESGVDTAAKAGSGKASEMLGVATPYGKAINFVNDTLKGLGAPAEVTNISGLAADITPEKTVENVLRQGGRGITNLVDMVTTGDDTALEQQQQEILKGDGGTPMQGYMAYYDAFDRMSDGEDPHDAIVEATNGMDGGVVEQVYENVLGDGDHSGAHTEEIPEGGFKPTSGNRAIDFVCESLIGL